MRMVTGEYEEKIVELYSKIKDLYNYNLWIEN